MMHRSCGKKGVNSVSIVDSIIKSSASRKTYFSVLTLCTFSSDFGWKEHASETRRNFSPLFNGNAVLLSSGAQTDRALLSRKKALNCHTKMYLFPLAQIVATYHCFTPTTYICLYKTIFRFLINFPKKQDCNIKIYFRN